MAILTNLDTLANRAHTTTSELTQCALSVTHLPDVCLNDWLEEKLHVAFLIYGNDLDRASEISLSVWLRQTLALVIGVGCDHSDSEFLRACGDSLEEYICNPLRREIVLTAGGENVYEDEQQIFWRNLPADVQARWAGAGLPTLRQIAAW